MYGKMKYYYIYTPFYTKKYSTFSPYSHISLIQVIIALRTSEARFVVGVFYAPTSDSEKNIDTFPNPFKFLIV